MIIVSKAAAPYLIGAVILGLGALYFRGVRGVSSDAARAAVNVAGGAAEGIIHGASDLLGIPTPNQSQCEQAKSTGDAWAASWACPAGDFLKWWIK